MKTKLIILIFMLVSTTAFSQKVDSTAFKQLQKEIRQLRIELQRQKTSFSKQLSEADRQIERLQTALKSESEKLASMAEGLGVSIADTRMDVAEKITFVNRRHNAFLRYGIAAVAALLLLTAIVFMLVQRKQKSDRRELIKQLEEQKISIEEQLVDEFSRQAEIMETLVETIKAQPVLNSTASILEHDHSLSLKLADEITLMERNISLMDSGTKGLKQLNRSIEKLKDNLASNGYEIPEMLGKPYDGGMKATIINSIQDDSLAPDEKVITRIIKPQVNYRGRMIQNAQIEVSVG
ncbi:MAG: hypothetical protein LBD35_06525 [Prevotellaceae bacterium]|jgi:uncharacterized membrane-anchored protein YhcB (DUF1043 family)|nr:hypothetical protein [Prevotellaceae bacterium]